MPLGVLLASLIALAFVSRILLTTDATREYREDQTTVNPSTRQLSHGHGVIQGDSDGLPDASLEQDKHERESVETALIRTCRTISTLSHSANCGDWTLSSQMWSFVGPSGTTGSLDGVFTGTTSATFACAPATRNAFARKLARAAIPSAEVVGKGYVYNLSGLNDTFTDPCGYIDIVGK